MHGMDVVVAWQDGHVSATMTGEELASIGMERATQNPNETFKITA